MLIGLNQNDSEKTEIGFVEDEDGQREDKESIPNDKWQKKRDDTSNNIEKDKAEQGQPHLSHCRFRSLETSSFDNGKGEFLLAFARMSFFLLAYLFPHETTFGF